MEENKDFIQIQCPFHEDKHPSLAFNKKTKKWKCFSCKMEGNIEELLLKYFDIVLKKIASQ